MKKYIILLIASFMAFSVQAQYLEEIDWMSEQYPPYNFVEDGKPQGITFDVLMEIFKRIGFKKDPKEIKFMPWARSYRKTLREPGTALFSMTYTEKRAKLFKFVRNIVISKIGLIGKKNKNLKISSTEDIKKLKIGVVRDDIGQQLIKALGIKKLEYSNYAKNMVKKLDLGRIDVIAYGVDVAKWHMKKVNIDPNKYENLYTLKEGEMGYAFYRDTSDDLIKKLQKTLDDLKKEGFVDKVSEKYLK